MAKHLSELPKQLLSEENKEEELINLSEAFVNHPLMAPAVVSNILGFLKDEKTALDLAATNSFFESALRQNGKMIIQQRKDSAWLDKLLAHIDTGNEDEVTAMLEQCNASDPTSLQRLLNQASWFKDHTGRNFHAITALQLALWSLDTPMYNILKQYMHDEDINTQTRELADYGLIYNIPRRVYDRLIQIAPNSNPPIELDADAKKLDEDFVTLREKHFNWGFAIFQEAIDKYINAFNRIQETDQAVKDDWQRLDQLWLDIGLTQRYLTAPFINAYCSNLSFTPIPDFSVETLPRDSLFYNWITDNKEDWFSLVCDDFSSEERISSYKVLDGGDWFSSVYDDFYSEESICISLYKMPDNVPLPVPRPVGKLTWVGIPCAGASPLAQGGGPGLDAAGCAALFEARTSDYTKVAASTIGDSANSAP